ncbi:MAG: YraN family protein [Propionibacteriaceae bacterium]|nr:YraN family protein [Propionibacteriaceae bacterium]
MKQLTKPHALGRRGEDLAVQHLTAQGWTIIDRNWRCQEGELDIIAHDPRSDELVFVEVKTRAGLGFGDPLDAVAWRKQRQLRRLCLLWLTEHGLRVPAIRLDAIGVLLLPGQRPQFRHVRGIDG